MVTTDKDFQSYKDNDKPCTFYGLSTDDKPTTMTVNEKVFDVVGGSAFVEIDTGGIYMYDEENQEWYQMNSGSGGGGGGSSTLVGLTDVDISNPTDGQTLIYNATSGKWENGESAGGGVLLVSESQDALSMTWQQIYDAAIDDGKLVILRIFNEDYWYIKYLKEISADPEYNVYMVRFEDTQYYTQSASGYPEQSIS